VEIFEKFIQNTSEYELNLFVFLFSFLEYIIPVVPGDLALAFGVFMAVYEGYSATLIYISSIAGGTIGALVSILIGSFIRKKYDQSRLSGLLKRFIAHSDDKIQKAIELLTRYGLLIIIANRFIPILRGPIVFAAGYSGINLTKAISGAIISALLFNMMITTVSFFTGNNFELIKSFLSNYFRGFIILVIVVFIIYKTLTEIFRRRR